MTDLSPIILLLVGALAVARITALIVHDSILEPVRHRIWLLSPPSQFPEEGQPFYAGADRRGIGLPASLYREPGFFGQLLACHHCVGVWVASFLVASYNIIPEATTTTAVVAALAQASDIAIKAAR